MASTIKLKNGSGAPLASDLVQGEPALDLTNKRLYTEDSGGTVIEVGTNPSALAIAGTDVTATATELNVLDGITATTTELNYTDGVTSAIQTQLDAKAPIDGATFTGTTTIPTADINGGTIDGVTIGGASAGAGTFTTLQADTSLNVDGTVTADGLTVDGNAQINNTSITLDLMESDTTDLNSRIQSQNGEFRINTLNDAKTAQFIRFDVDHATGDISFYEDTGTTPKFFWDASAESLGIGKDAPAQLLHIKGDDTETGSSAPGLTIEQDGTGDASINFLLTGTRRWLLGVDNSDSDAFKIVGANQSDFTDPALTIKTGGTVGIGTTDGTAFNGGAYFDTQTYSRKVLYLSHSDSGNRTLVLFGGNGSQAGGINASPTSVTYGTGSDYRLKEDWVPMSDSIDRVKALNPVNFAWKADGTRVDGFLAHEAQEVVPEAVTGTKDAMRTEDALDEEGNIVGTKEVPDYQGIDQSKLVPLLTGALKEAIARIEILEAEVTTLKGN